MWYHLPDQIEVDYQCEGTSQSHSAKSTISKSLTQEVNDAAQSTSTSLAPIQGSQLMDTPPMPLPTSPAAPAKITEQSK